MGSSVSPSRVLLHTLDEKGAPLRPLTWKDTLNIPMKATSRFLVTFDEHHGTWMFHCHILDHAEGGFMGMLQVGNAASEHSIPEPTAKARLIADLL